MGSVSVLPRVLGEAVQVEREDGKSDIEAEQAGLIALVADVLEAGTLDSALDAFAAALPALVGAEQAAIALDQRSGLVLRALTQRALIDPSATESQLLTDAMQEACDRECAVRWPVEADARLGVMVAHRALAGRRRSIAYCSMPLYDGTRLVGAMLLQRRDGYTFSDEQVTHLERIGLVIAPLLALRRQAEQGVLSVCRARSEQALVRHLGTERAGRRALVALFCVALLAALLIPMDAPIGAAAEVVPLERRLVTAPHAGFVQSVDVVAGESVASGHLLATLDTRDLALQAARHDSEIATAEVEFRAAMGSFDRQASAIARARLAQSRAQRMLVERQLEQSEIRAPIDGLVLAAEPLEAQGAPVSRGDTLFEIAPADGYEVHLLVDEAEIRNVSVGQTGRLSLRAQPDHVIELSVQSIHPIAENGDGASRFRVRAALVTDEGAIAPGILRPGQSGRAQLDAGHASLATRLLRPLWQRVTELKWQLTG